MPELSQTWNYNDANEWRKFKVPNNVKILKIELTGGGSGTRQGGRVFAKVRVTDKDEIHFRLGRQGHVSAGRNGGGTARGGGAPGGDGGVGRNGGNGGGGASEIRLNSNSGKLLAVAGGAGGDSGDGGAGGTGGTKSGQKGTRAGGGTTNVATGGGQSKGGSGGTVGGAAAYNGDNAPDSVLARGGKGGQVPNNTKAHGGGGGGGGYRAGGGGQAGKAGSGGHNGGGGGGGSSFVDELYDIDFNDANGGTEDGSLTIRYQEGGDFPPATPSAVKVNGIDPVDEQPLRSFDVTISAKPTDSTEDQDVRIVLYLSSYGVPLTTDPEGRIVPYIRRNGTWDPTGHRDVVTVNRLDANTKYWGKLYSQDKRGQLSNSYVGLTFWTDRKPDPPTLTGPEEDSEFESTDTIAFTWDDNDPDRDNPTYPETPTYYGWRWRRAATATIPADGWHNVWAPGDPASLPVPASTFPPGFIYEWQAQTRDPQNLWSDWSASRHFSVTAVAIPPLPLSPSNDEALINTDEILFTWQFRTQVPNEVQETADLRYRAVGEGEDDWVVLTGDLLTPGGAGGWLLPAETFLPGTHIEWQVRATTSSSTTSDWSVSRTFWSTAEPGGGFNTVPIDLTRVQEPLGQGVNRAYIYKRGGLVYLGEIKPMVDITWGRRRDDITTCTIHVNQWSREQLEVYRGLKPWAHELVVYREVAGQEPERVWEGPITRLSGAFEIEAWDVMKYVYRRVMRQGYNDSYQINNGQQVGLKTVVHRARQIILNALVYDDPNVLPYLTALQHPGDAIQSRIVKGYNKTAWEEVDELAAHAGLDYTTLGRRIILNDTHRSIGRLPVMGNGDFSQEPVVTVYGMSYATDYAVTNNNGVYGEASRRSGADFGETGRIELLASQYGESDVAGTGTEDLTPEQIATLQANLKEQAERNIAARYPMPIVVRVPDNASLNPDINLGINQLVPGVWIPLRATGGVIEASQWQKLDSVTVTQTEAGEKISVVMSPAPNGGADPDAETPEEA